MNPYIALRFDLSHRTVAIAHDVVFISLCAQIHKYNQITQHDLFYILSFSFFFLRPSFSFSFLFSQLIAIQFNSME